ncbi:MAG: hypothetical protein D9V47_08450 [Clostridia bacterium]|nr:MAG: hypothetical protein D9V47_08450 [Clostridia bacterium]
MAKRFKKPPKDLPDEIPTICMNSVYLGGYCDDQGPRNRVLTKLMNEFKAAGKVALADFHAFVRERWMEAKAEYEREHGIVPAEPEEAVSEG